MQGTQSNLIPLPVMLSCRAIPGLPVILIPLPVQPLIVYRGDRSIGYNSAHEKTRQRGALPGRDADRAVYFFFFAVFTLRSVKPA